MLSQVAGTSDHKRLTKEKKATRILILTFLSTQCNTSGMYQSLHCCFYLRKSNQWKKEEWKIIEMQIANFDICSFFLNFVLVNIKTMKHNSWSYEKKIVWNLSFLLHCWKIICIITVTMLNNSPKKYYYWRYTYKNILTI